MSVHSGTSPSPSNQGGGVTGASAPSSSHAGFPPSSSSSSTGGRCGLSQEKLDAHPKWLTDDGCCKAKCPDGKTVCGDPYSKHVSTAGQTTHTSSFLCHCVTPSTFPRVCVIQFLQLIAPLIDIMSVSYYHSIPFLFSRPRCGPINPTVRLSRLRCHESTADNHIGSDRAAEDHQASRTAADCSDSQLQLHCLSLLPSLSQSS